MSSKDMRKLIESVETPKPSMKDKILTAIQEAYTKNDKKLWLNLIQIVNESGACHSTGCHIYSRETPPAIVSPKVAPKVAPSLASTGSQKVKVEIADNGAIYIDGIKVVKGSNNKKLVEIDHMFRCTKDEVIPKLQAFGYDTSSIPNPAHMELRSEIGSVKPKKAPVDNSWTTCHPPRRGSGTSCH